MLVSGLYYESFSKEWRTRSNLATGVGVIISYSKASSSARVFSFVGWTTSFFATTLATNVICTCTSFSTFRPPPTSLYWLYTYSALIAFRIWSVDRVNRKYRETKSALRPVLAVVIESGAIYSASLTILLAIYLSGNLGYLILSQAVSSFHYGGPSYHSSSRTRNV